MSSNQSSGQRRLQAPGRLKVGVTSKTESAYKQALIAAKMENGAITAAEIQANKSALEAARDAICGQFSILNQGAA